MSSNLHASDRTETTGGPTARAPVGRSPWPALSTAGALVVLIILWDAPRALIVWGFDGVLAGLFLGCATLGGGILLNWLRLGRLTLAERLVLSAGLGLGALALVLLGLGVCGWIGLPYRWLLALLLGMAAFIGLGSLYRMSLLWSFTALRHQQPSAGWARWLLLAVVPCVALIMLVAVLPPGVLWEEEGYGYDVLEYHLQLPREYFEAGRITYLPHNVYASFPAAVEMLYLGIMMLTGQTIDAWGACQGLNGLLAGLVIWAAWLAGRAYSPNAGVMTALVAASSGWLVYLSGVAYVENGLLFFGMLAAACLVRMLRARSESPDNGLGAGSATHWALLAGLCAGFACGCKYTGPVLVAGPLLVWIVVAVGRRRPRPADPVLKEPQPPDGPVRTASADVGDPPADPAPAGRPPHGVLRLSMVYCLAVLPGVAPWLIKNWAFTGNPVFPLAPGLFPTSPPGWGPEQAEHFRDSHRPAEAERTIPARTAALTQHLFTEPTHRFGVLLFPLALVGLLRHRGPANWALAAVLAVQILVWFWGTHLYARFAVPLLIPLIALAGPAAVSRAGKLNPVLVAVTLVGTVLHLVPVAGLYREHVQVGDTRLHLEGATQAFTRGLLPAHAHLGFINEILPAEARVLMVGDARAYYFQRPVDYWVVFNRHAFADLAAEADSVADIVTWLQRQGCTHVYVDWAEIHRLRRSRYGFPTAITESLFEQLREAGLKVVEMANYATRDSGVPAWVIYEVPAA